MAGKFILTPAQEAYFVRHFRNTKNADLAAKLGVSWRTVVRLARERGLAKTRQFMKKCQAQAVTAANASNLENGTYPPKGYRIPRSEEFQFKKGGKPWDRCGRRKWNDAVRRGSEKRRQTVREERIRVKWGLEQKTKLRVISIPEQKRMDRYYLKKRGYILDEANCIAYWTPETRRATRLEAKPKRYYEFKKYTMEFFISRTSYSVGEVPPCEGAVPTGEKIQRYGGYEYIYSIEINTLDELISLSKKVGNEIIVGVNDNGNPYLEIYDGYRE